MRPCGCRAPSRANPPLGTSAAGSASSAARRPGGPAGSAIPQARGRGKAPRRIGAFFALGRRNAAESAWAPGAGGLGGWRLGSASFLICFLFFIFFCFLFDPFDLSSDGAELLIDGSELTVFA